MKDEITRSLVFTVFFGCLTLNGGCGKETNGLQSKPAASNDRVASQRKELIAQHVLAAQLAPHHEFEAKTSFSPSEAIPASLYLTDSPYVEPRRISAFLICEEVVVEELSVAVGAAEEREVFDFRFIKTPRPPGAYEIKFVEIARSSGKSVLLARLFLNVE